MGTDQQFSLRWNNYLEHITNVFDSLRYDENLVDVTLCCEGRKLRAHKMLLSACSSYFRDIFKENPCQHPVIIFRNVRYEDLEAIVSFIYRGEVNVKQEDLSSFLSTAELLEIKGLTAGISHCLPQTIVEDDVSSNEEQVRPKPDSPVSKKRKTTQNESPTSIQVKTETDIMENEIDETQLSPEPENIQTEPEATWAGDENMDAINDLTISPGTSDGINDTLQVFAHGLWRRLHPSLKRFGCDECGKVFKHPRSLDHHKKMHEGRTTCPFCRRVFGRMYALRLHMSSSHPGQITSLQSTKTH